MRIVIDTNIWVSGLLWKGAPWRILRLAEEKQVELWATPSMLEELQEVLAYPRLQPRRLELGLDIAELIIYATALVCLVQPIEIEAIVSSDPDDDIFLACATQAEVQYLVSGDKHLLNLGEWRGISIVTPHTFLEREFPIYTV